MDPVGSGEWTIPDLPYGGTATLELQATVYSGTLGQVLTNTAWRVSSTQPDTLAADDTATVSLSVTSDLPPTVTIAEPADGAVFDPGSVVTFSASAQDAEDGDLMPDIAWTSDLGGSLGTGGSISISDLTAGSHVIAATVTDSDGATTADTVAISITAPSGSDLAVVKGVQDAAILEGQTTTFIVQAQGPQSGSMSDVVIRDPLGVGLTFVDATTFGPASTFDATVGGGLQNQWSFFLETSTHGGTTVTLTTSDARTLLLSTDGQSVGTGSLDVFVPDGSNRGFFWIQGVPGQVGTPTLTVSPQAFTDGTNTVTIETPYFAIGGSTTNPSSTAANDELLGGRRLVVWKWSEPTEYQ